MSFTMSFGAPLVRATFIKRLNRFVVEVDIDGNIHESHLHDPGRLKEILTPGRELMLTRACTNNRKTGYSVTLANMDGVWVSLNSVLPNRFLEECIRAQKIWEFRDYVIGRREIRWGNSRFDFHLMAAGIDILLEVKSVTLVRDGVALFPDAPTKRGVKHVKELIAAAEYGYCGTVFFLVQRSDAEVLIPNEKTDPEFSSILNKAYRKGIEVISYTSKLSPDGISLGRRIPLRLS